MAVMETVDYVADTTSDGSVSGVAVGLRSSLADFSFIVQLYAMKPVLSVVNEISVLLQSSHIDIIQSNQYITNLSRELERLRTDAAFDDALKKAPKFAVFSGIEATFKEAKIKAQSPSMIS